jgi:endogenous inhibitor of DNA gyrase (YacG/DUF329 family)
MIDLGHWFEESYVVPDNEIVKTVKIKNEKQDELKEEDECENEESTKVDEADYDENDY